MKKLAHNKTAHAVNFSLELPWITLYAREEQDISLYCIFAMIFFSPLYAYMADVCLKKQGNWIYTAIFNQTSIYFTN